ncbi:unnamed protein product [Schistosoma curassoni]|uniref:Uncharacterized protein n=1 Tax=Schistosoma curassoni TaxID=6186 RepID=A0A183JPD1_9TREM|nr:unnamed protein product [Schistosoma curassoni]
MVVKFMVVHYNMHSKNVEISYMYVKNAVSVQQMLKIYVNIHKQYM